MRWDFFPERDNSGSIRLLTCNLFPNGKMDLLPINNAIDLGAAIRQRRTELRLTQEELADVSRVTLRFVSEIERGKESAQFAGISRVLASLGLDLFVKPR